MHQLVDLKGNKFTARLALFYNLEREANPDLTLFYVKDWALRFPKGAPVLCYPGRIKDIPEGEANTLYMFNPKKALRLLIKKQADTTRVRTEEIFTGSTHVQLENGNIHRVEDLVLYLTEKR